MEEYDRGCEVVSKQDGSPVTAADQRAEAIICEYLARVVPLTPLCAEEAMAAGGPAQVAERFLLVDPLDGTREFLAGNGEFTINVASNRRRGPQLPALSMRPRSGGCGPEATRRSRAKCASARNCLRKDCGKSGRGARRRVWSLLLAVRISIHSRIPSSKRCRSAKHGSLVRR